MKHITEASDDEIIAVIDMAMGDPGLTRIAALRAAFDFSPPQPTEGVAELIEPPRLLETAETWLADPRDSTQGYNLVMHLSESLAALSRPLLAAPSDEGVAELIAVSNGIAEYALESETYLLRVGGIDDRAQQIGRLGRTVKQLTAALSTPQRPTPSDEELLAAYHGDDQHNHLIFSDHAQRLRAVAALGKGEAE